MVGLVGSDIITAESNDSLTFVGSLLGGSGGMDISEAFPALFVVGVCRRVEVGDSTGPSFRFLAEMSSGLMLLMDGR